MPKGSLLFLKGLGGNCPASFSFLSTIFPSANAGLGITTHFLVCHPMHKGFEDFVLHSCCLLSSIDDSPRFSICQIKEPLEEVKVL